MNRNPILWLVPVVVSVTLLSPGLVQAQDDLEVTIRTVADDQELDDSFVQQLELPDFVKAPAGTDYLDNMQMGAEDLVEEAREDILDFEAALAEQSRDTRDSLDIELPGELIGEEPGLDLPGIEEPELELPDSGDTDLDLLDDNPLNL